MSSKQSKQHGGNDRLEDLSQDLATFDRTSLKPVREAVRSLSSTTFVVGVFLKRWTEASQRVYDCVNRLWARFHDDELGVALANIDLKAKAPIAARDALRKLPSRSDDIVDINVGGDIMKFTADEINSLILADVVLPFTISSKLKKRADIDHHGTVFLDGYKDTLGAVLNDYAMKGIPYAEHRPEGNKKRKTSPPHALNNQPTDTALSRFYDAFRSALVVPFPTSPNDVRPVSPFVLHGGEEPRSQLMTNEIWSLLPNHIKIARPYLAFSHSGEISAAKVAELERNVLDEDKTLVVFKTKNFIVAAFYSGIWPNRSDFSHEPSDVPGSAKETFIIMQGLGPCFGNPLGEKKTLVFEPDLDLLKQMSESQYCKKPYQVAYENVTIRSLFHYGADLMIAHHEFPSNKRFAPHLYATYQFGKPVSRYSPSDSVDKEVLKSFLDVHTHDDGTPRSDRIISIEIFLLDPIMLPGQVESSEEEEERDSEMSDEEEEDFTPLLSPGARTAPKPPDFPQNLTQERALEAEMLPKDGTNDESGRIPSPVTAPKPSPSTAGLVRSLDFLLRRLEPIVDFPKAKGKAVNLKNYLEEMLEGGHMATYKIPRDDDNCYTRLEKSLTKNAPVRESLTSSVKALKDVVTKTNNLGWYARRRFAVYQTYSEEDKADASSILVRIKFGSTESPQHILTRTDTIMQFPGSVLYNTLKMSNKIPGRKCYPLLSPYQNSKPETLADEYRSFQDNIDTEEGRKKYKISEEAMDAVNAKASEIFLTRFVNEHSPQTLLEKLGENDGAKIIRLYPDAPKICAYLDILANEHGYKTIDMTKSGIHPKVVTVVIEFLRVMRLARLGIVSVAHAWAGLDVEENMRNHLILALDALQIVREWY